MNRTALSVVALAVGAVLIFGLYNVYKPQVNNTAHDVFDKVHIGRMADGNPSPIKKNMTLDQAINAVPNNKWGDNLTVNMQDKNGKQYPFYTKTVTNADGKVLSFYTKDGNTNVEGSPNSTSPSNIKDMFTRYYGNWAFEELGNANDVHGNPDMWTYSYNPSTQTLTAQEK